MSKQRKALVLLLATMVTLVALLPSVAWPPPGCIYSDTQCDPFDTESCIFWLYGVPFPGLMKKCYLEYYCPEYYTEGCGYCLCQPVVW